MLTEKEILELLREPKNRDLLEIARERQRELKHFYSNESPKLIFDKAEPLLEESKFKKFKQVYKNHPQTLVNKVITHYRKIYEAHGRVFRFDFTDIEAEARFNTLRETIYDGLADDDYWRTYGHILTFTEPNSIFISGTGPDGVPIITRAKLSTIHDVDADEKGIRYLIVVEKVEKEGEDPYNRYYIYDDTNYYVYREVSGDEFEKEVFVTEEGETVKEGPHGSTKCPCHFVYDVNEGDNHIVKKTPISDSIKDLYTYTILKTMYENYKYFSAFGTQIEAEVRCEHTDGGMVCQSGLMMPASPSVKRTPYKCPECSKNKNVAGRVIRIPINMQGNEEFVKGLGNLFQRIEADTDILEFHASDLERLSNDILADCIGKGFGEGYKKQAVNEDQIRHSFDDMEANLTQFKGRIESALEYNLSRTAEQFSESFKSLSINLGTKFFLKDLEQLYKELELLLKGTSDLSYIQQKQYEIILTENKHNEQFLDRQKILSIIQPFIGLTSTYIQANRGQLLEQQPRALTLYENFLQVVNIFEMLHGSVESWGKDLNTKKTRIDNIISKFNEILEQYILKDDNAEREKRQKEREDAERRSFEITGGNIIGGKASKGPKAKAS